MIEAKLIKGIQMLRELDADMPAQTMVILLAIGMNPGITQKELSEETRVTISSVSRNLVTLSGEKNRRGRQGLGLIDITKDMRDPRIHRHYLSRKGQDFFGRFSSICSNGPEGDDEPRRL